MTTKQTLKGFILAAEESPRVRHIEFDFVLGLPLLKQDAADQLEEIVDDLINDPPLPSIDSLIPNVEW